MGEADGLGACASSPLGLLFFQRERELPPSLLKP